MKAKPTKLNVTKIHYHEGRRYGFDKTHGWLCWFQSEIAGCLSGWLPCVPKHIKTTETTA